MDDTKGSGIHWYRFQQLLILIFCLDLMTLKRVNKQQEVKAVVKDSSKNGAFISSIAGGLCFDFSPKDPNM